MEVRRLRVQLELQPLAYARAKATPDPSRICELHHRRSSDLLLLWCRPAAADPIQSLA